VTANAPIAGVILAGGRASRFDGGSKAEALLAGEPLLARVIGRFRPQVDSLLINLNQSSTLECVADYPLLADTQGDFSGPLAGLHAACGYLEKANSAAKAIAIAPCDGPFLPLNFVSALANALVRENAAIACVRYRGQMQPTFSLWRRSTFKAVDHHFRELGEGGFKGLFRALPTVFVDWPQAPVDPFFNINTQAELALAATLLEKALLEQSP
jgi:molybdopterin-guanine dinucleotide biosynthesis protein A